MSSLRYTLSKTENIENMEEKNAENEGPQTKSAGSPPGVVPLYVSFDTTHLEPYLPPTTLPPHPQGTAPTLPHVTLTYAQSLDSQISLAPSTQTMLSGPETKAMTHYLRTRHDAILVGAGTANADNPSLNSRLADEDGIVGLEKQPRPVVLDARGLWQPRRDGKVFELARKGEGKAPWWIVGAEGRLGDRPPGYDEAVRLVRESGGLVLEMREEKDWKEILGLLAVEGIQSLMVEGGGSIINGLLEAVNQKYVNSVIVTIAPTYLGKGGVTISPNRTGPVNEARLDVVKWISMGQDVVMAGRIKDTKE